MRLVMTWPPEVVAAVADPEDAPPDPIPRYLEQAQDRGLPAGARILHRAARTSRRGHPFWYQLFRVEETVTLRATLLFLDVVIRADVTGAGLGEGTPTLAAVVAALDDADLDFSDEVASLHQLYAEDES